MTVAANPYFQHLPESRRQELAALDDIEPGNLFEEIDLLRLVTLQALRYIHSLRELDPRRCLMNEIEVILHTIPAINRILDTILFIAQANKSESTTPQPHTPDSQSGFSSQISPQVDLGEQEGGRRLSRLHKLVQRYRPPAHITLNSPRYHSFPFVSRASWPIQSPQVTLPPAGEGPGMRA